MTSRPSKTAKPEAAAPKAEKKPAAPVKKEAPIAKPAAAKKAVAAPAAPKKAEPVPATAVKKQVVKQPAPAPVAAKKAAARPAADKKVTAPATAATKPPAKKATAPAEPRKEATKGGAKKAAPVNVESEPGNKKNSAIIKTSTAAAPSVNQSRDVKASPSRGKTTSASKADKGMAESETSSGNKTGGGNSAAIAKQIAQKALKSVVGSRLPQALKNKKAQPVAKSPSSGPKISQQPVLSRDEKLAKLLAMRGVKTKENMQEAAKSARAGEKLVPTSVAKAAEFAETRKISSMLKKIEDHKAEEQGPTAAEIAAKKKKRKKAPYTKFEIKELRQILESERDRLLKDMAVINDMAASSEASMSHTFSNHQADAATDSSALETMFVTRRYEEDRLRQVISALEKVEAGDFGLCDMCADEPMGLCETCPYIPIGRLRAKPFAKLCVACRQQMEKKNGKR